MPRVNNFPGWRRAQSRNWTVALAELPRKSDDDDDDEAEAEELDDRRLRFDFLFDFFLFFP